MKPMIPRKNVFFGFTVLLFCFLFAVSASAIDTPWVTLQPDSESASESAQTESDEPTDGKNESGTPTAGQSEPETAPATEEIPSTDAATEKVSAQTSAKKRGCGSTIPKTVVWFPILFSFLLIGREIPLKRE